MTFLLAVKTRRKIREKKKEEREERGIKEFIKYKHSWITVENMDHYRKKVLETAKKKSLFTYLFWLTKQQEEWFK